MGNIHVKLYEIWTSGSEGDVVLRKVYGRTDGRTVDGQRPITKAHLSLDELKMNDGKPDFQVYAKYSAPWPAFSDSHRVDQGI